MRSFVDWRIKIDNESKNSNYSEMTYGNTKYKKKHNKTNKNSIIELTDSNFYDMLSDSKDIWLVRFFGIHI